MLANIVIISKYILIKGWSFYLGGGGQSLEPYQKYHVEILLINMD